MDPIKNMQKNSKKVLSIEGIYNIFLGIDPLTGKKICPKRSPNLQLSRRTIGRRKTYAYSKQAEFKMFLLNHGLLYYGKKEK